MLTARAGGPDTPSGYILIGMDPGYIEDKEALLRRLSRIEGQVRGIGRMIESEEYCIDVITQIGAVSRALDQVSLNLLEDHVGHCVRGAIGQGGKEADRKVDEMLATVERFARTR
jgi:CsoR family transcriptional regulator, copper-sensing transcriptional repressor